jgi:hypothetical protein
MNPFPRVRSTAPPLVLLLVLLLTACSGASSGAPAAAAPTAAPAANEDQIMPYPAAAQPTTAAAAAVPTAAPAAEQAGGGAPSAAGTPQATPNALNAVIGDPNRKIVKNADLALEVPNVQIALSQISAVAAQSGGYVLETSTNYGQQNQPQAVIKMAVPVDQFDAALQRIREAAGRVLSEQASGVDVTQEFVDVQSQIANLEATEARIREFLKQATTVEEALKVNAQLTDVEGQLNVLKGRINFLSQRAAYSTISVQLQQPPPPTPTPAPTATPTPTPTATPLPAWNPGKTAEQATSTLSIILQALATVAIWLAIVVLPLAVPVFLIALIVRVIQLRLRRPRPPLPPASQEPEPRGSP